MFPISNNRKWSYKLFSTSNECGMKLQVVSNFNRVNNEATSCLRVQTSKDETKSRFPTSNNRKWSYKFFQHQTSLKWSYSLFPTSIDSIMKLQVVSGLKREKMKLKVVSNFKQPKMKLQVVFNFKPVWDEVTSCFQLQSIQ